MFENKVDYSVLNPRSFNKNLNLWNEEARRKWVGSCESSSEKHNVKELPWIVLFAETQINKLLCLEMIS